MPLLEATRVIKSRRRVVLANKYFQKLLVRYARSKGLLDNIRVKVERAPEFSSPPSRDSSEYISGRDYNLGGSSRNGYVCENHAFSGRDRVDIPTFSSRDHVSSGGDIYSRSANDRYHSRDINPGNGHAKYGESTKGSSQTVSRNDDESQSSDRSTTPRSTDNSSRLNSLYRDLYERFDRLTETLTSNGSPFNRRTQSSSVLPQTERKPAAEIRPTSRQDNALTQSLRYRSSRPASRYGESYEGGYGGSSTIPRWSVTSPGSVGGGGDATPLLRHGSVRQRPGSAVPWSDAGSRSRSTASTHRSSHGPDAYSYGLADVGKRPSNREFIYAIWVRMFRFELLSITRFTHVLLNITAEYFVFIIFRIAMISMQYLIFQMRN